MDISQFKFNADGLICALAQDVENGEVLMQAYMDAHALEATLESGYAHYHSRSRNCLWKKGETSGHVQRVVKMLYDCDADCVLMLVRQSGAACHTGNRTCFYRTLKQWESVPDYKVVFEDAATVHERRLTPKVGSYTNYLFDKGREKICKKVGEEATETVIAAMKDDRNELVGELADLLFHATVLMEECSVTFEDVFGEMERRKGKAAAAKYSGDIATNRDQIVSDK